MSVLWQRASAGRGVERATDRLNFLARARISRVAVSTSGAVYYVDWEGMTFPVYYDRRDDCYCVRGVMRSFSDAIEAALVAASREGIFSV